MVEHLVLGIAIIALQAGRAAAADPARPLHPALARDQLTCASCRVEAGLRPGIPGRQEAVLDSVRADLARGRPWHASERLRGLYPDGAALSPELALLFAEAEAGWEDWEAVLARLEGLVSQGELDDPRAWYLLARAREAAENRDGALEAYQRSIDRPRAADGPDLQVLDSRVRRVRIQSRLRDWPSAASEIRLLMRDDPTLGAWTALEVAGLAAEEGREAETIEFLSLVVPDEVRGIGWDLPAEALLAAGDSAGAEVAYWSVLPALSSGRDRAAAWERVGVLRLARGDSAGARGAFRRVLMLAPAGESGLPAAEALVELGFDSTDVALTAAETLAGRDRLEEAMAAYEAYEVLSGSSPGPRVLLGRARVHLGLGQRTEALRLAGELETATDSTVATQALLLEARTLRALGRERDARAAEDRILERFPGRAEAVEIAFSRAASAEARGDTDGAIRGFRETITLSPAQNLAGEARMRMGQIFLATNRPAAALEVYEGYLRDFPAGRRWDEAAFWAGRTLRALGRGEEAEEMLSLLSRRFPLSYYSVQGEGLLGRPFAPDVAELGDTLPLSPELRRGLTEIDRLQAAGMGEALTWQIDRIAAGLRKEEDPSARQGKLLRFALELNARGLTREGINLGWEVQSEGRSWDRALLEAIYPFPYRPIVEAEAEERGLDPYLIAALIRQESAFWVQARSVADARGLMQVLPSTGEQLARSAGPRLFNADRQLYVAEINIHLGSAFLEDMLVRFGEELPLVLSAYNAGPTRARRWSSFPEAADPPRFIERIPFTETRGYVKNVLRNRAIYAWLYGGSPP